VRLALWGLWGALHAAPPPPALGPLAESRCLAQTAPPKSTVAVLKPNTVIHLGSENGPTLTVRADSAPFTVCVEQPTHVVVVGRGLAMRFVTAKGAFKPVPATEASWAAYRKGLKAEAPDAPCLKSFAKGTALFDRADGAVVAVVIDDAISGAKWETAAGRDSEWAALHPPAPFAALKLWVPDGLGEPWCTSGR
jgi:hypothetical protein